VFSGHQNNEKHNVIHKK